MEFTVTHALLTKNEIKISVLNKCKEFTMEVMPLNKFDCWYLLALGKVKNRTYTNLEDVLERLTCLVLERFVDWDLKRNGLTKEDLLSGL